MTSTKGNTHMNTQVLGYTATKGDIFTRGNPEIPYVYAEIMLTGKRGARYISMRIKDAANFQWLALSNLQFTSIKGNISLPVSLFAEVLNESADA